MINADEPENIQHLSNNRSLFFKSELTNGKALRIFGTYENPYFVAKDIAEILEYKNTMKAIRDHIDNEDKLTYNEIENLDRTNQTPEHVQGHTILTYNKIERTIHPPVIKSFSSNNTLQLQGVNIIARKEDGYINLTQLCQAGQKLFGNWKNIGKTKAFLEALSISIGIPIGSLIKYNSAYGNERATWGHPQVAINVAQWISPQFDVQVSKWVYELLVTGSVTLGQEKSNKELEQKYQEKIHRLEEEKNRLEEEKNRIELSYNVIEKKYNSSLKKHRYHKFKETGPSLYIIDCGLDYADGIERIKIGIAGVPRQVVNDDGSRATKTESIDGRLRKHRTLWPRLRIFFLLFTQDVVLLENSLKRIYSSRINPGGHEIIEAVNTRTIIKKIKELLMFLNIEEDDYRICSEKEIKKYNDNVLTTLKENNYTDNHEADQNIPILEFIEEVVEEDEEKVEIEVEIDDEDEVVEEDERKVEIDDEDEDEVVEEDEDEKETKEETKEEEEINDDLEKFTVIQLRTICRENKISQVGIKNILIERIRNFRKTNKLEAHKNSKKIYQYDLNGVFVEEFESIKAASKKHKYLEDTISLVLNGKSKTAYGYIWRYKNVNIEETELKKITKHSKAIEVIQVMQNGHEIRYESMVDASKKTGLSVGVIERKINKYKDGEPGFKYNDSSEKKKQLTKEQKIEIRRKYNSGISLKEIEKEYNKSIKQLRRVVCKED